MREPNAQRPATLFREEALAYHAGSAEGGEVLRLPWEWARRAYLLVVVLAVAAALFAALVQIGVYESGPAVVLAADCAEVATSEDGTVTAVAVRPGQLVTAGAPLVQLDDQRERQELLRIRREQELQLVRSLADPADQTSRQSLPSLHAAQLLATGRLSDRGLRAPHSGRIADIRIRTGQRLQAGTSALLLCRGDRFVLRALLPGRARPELAVGAPLRLELDGSKWSYQRLRVHEIGREVIGPDEARRALRRAHAEHFALAGPLVLVEAELPGTSFLVDHAAFPYADGLPGRVEVRVRQEPLGLLLFPWLREVLRHG
mgnify:CR=1 FL=1